MNRKDEHVSLAKAFHKQKNNSFDDVRIIHQSLPQSSYFQANIETELFGQKLTSPFFINAMTGGSEKTRHINQQLAMIAKETDLMLATGSVSAALKDPSLADSFKIVRQEFPDGILLANIGAGSSLEQAQRAVDLFQANALQIHLNAPQELVMPEGDRDFTDWLTLIEEITNHLDVPVIVKEVGFGMTRQTIQQLLDVGVKSIDIAGSGGTSFTQIENARRKKREFTYLNDFGITTVESLLEANEVPVPFELIASGSIRNAYDIFKALCFGAKSVGLSASLLNHLLVNDLTDTIALVKQWQQELLALYTLVGAKQTNDLKQVPLLFTGQTKTWCEARAIDFTRYSQR
ncbi:type 2 isopentenyl-diphosphate Delta-isomerase [Enterococcus sp. LJL98]